MSREDIKASPNDTWSLASSSTKITSTSEASTIVPEHKHPKHSTLVFTRLGPLRVNMRIFPENAKNEGLYFIHISGTMSNDTEITLHSGASKHGTILGSCIFNKFRPSKITLKSRTGSKSTMFLVAQSGCYQWAMPRTLEASDDSMKIGERSFIWRRAAELDRNPKKADALNLELCSSNPFEVHAVYAGALPGSGKGGVLELKDDLGEDFRDMLVLTLSSLVEKARQRRDRSGDNTARIMAFA
ncbi:hypothetical protein N7532_002358 [Penicillium argentinense]|uniref:Uncharacterized protein n=1 Tax=Penicillium argentinense TaxID=1131581 RepID=A0A9W9G0H5_9EURO|nr:uncharacterized protein N7532_002358 [Penicillium argentinense]KAJ5109713.1 hypothetical protein N7532_002358 [Penicillium argentinense]